jgi:anti-sigma B factor antagonist
MFSMDLCAPGCGDAVVVALRGELDVADAAAVAAGLAAAAADDQVLVVDLAGLKFIDSSGVAALARARAHARLTGGDLLLAAPQRQVMRLLAATRLTDVFGIHACAAGHAGLPRTPAPETAAPAGLSPAA